MTKCLLVYNALSQLFSSPSIIFLFRSLSILQIKESTIRECFIGNVEGFLQNSRLLTAFTLTETNHEINGIIEINVNCWEINQKTLNYSMMQSRYFSYILKCLMYWKYNYLECRCIISFLTSLWRICCACRLSV